MKRRRPRVPRWLPVASRFARFLVKAQILTLFLGLCLLGIVVGVSTRPAPGTLPFAELFDQMRVVSYRESPSDTTVRFLVELVAAGRVFGQYDVDGQRFLPPPQGRAYARAITGTTYPPLHVRGHVGYGFWLDIPRASGRSLLPEQFEELYQSTLGYLKPVSAVTGALGVLSGYSVGYRVATWNTSLASHRVEERVLATPGLGRLVTREAWKRVLLEPAVMSDENDVARFAAVAENQRLYAAFFRLALHDSDGFIPGEAARLSSVGHAADARTMLAFTEAARRAARDSVHLTSADFVAVERWASLLDQRGHWAAGTLPPAGEERARYLGTLAWYGLAPPSPDQDRVWVGPRMLVRSGDAPGFVSDEIPATGIGCPIAWRSRLTEANTSAAAAAGAWFADRPEFPALVAFGSRIGRGIWSAGRQIALAVGSRTRATDIPAGAAAARPVSPHEEVASVASRAPVVERVGSVVPGASRPARDSVPDQPVAYPLRVPGAPASVTLVTADSATAIPHVRAAQAAVDSALTRVGAEEPGIDPAPRLPGSALTHGTTGLDGVARARAADAAATRLAGLGVRDALVDVSGDIVGLGTSSRAEPWRIDIADPRERVPRLGWFVLRSGEAASTSGGYEPLAGPDPGPASADPRDGHPAEALLSITVVAPNATLADAWRTALLVLAPAEARRTLREHPELAAVLVESGADGVDTVWVESDLRERFQPDVAAATRLRFEPF